MLNKKGLFVLEIHNHYIDTLLHDVCMVGSGEESKALRIWDDILASLKDETKVKAEQINDFHPLIQHVLEEMIKGEKDFAFYYDGDFNDNIWSFLCKRMNLRVDRPICIQLSYVLNEIFIDYKHDSACSNAYIHTLLRLISQIPAFDIEIYEAEQKKDVVLFSYEDVCNGIGFCEQGYMQNLYFCQNNKLGQLSLEELQESFSRRKKAMLVKEQFTDFINVLMAKDEQAPAYVYVPYIYLYMGSNALREKMYQENAIDSMEYETWGLFHSFVNNDKIHNARFIVLPKALTDAYEHGFVKVHGGAMQLEHYKNDFLEDIDKTYKGFTKNNMLILDAEKVTNFKMPNVMIYSEPKHTLLIRTNVNKRYRLTRVANEVVKEELAKAFYHYFDSIYHDNFSLSLS